MNLNYLSVCSGIEAATVAWEPLGWTPIAFSEIEKFPCAVLAHHYPDVPNLGDMTEMDVEPLGQIDILVGGTPCQAFSVAGLRQSLNDARGNLTLSYVRLVHELVAGHGLRNAVWENVPGVLSTKDNAFGCFLGAIVGSDEPLLPPGGKRWPNAGMVSGPKGRAAWAIKDAQYFGLAQRRRRVFVVSDFGNGADPAAVLFELEGVRGNPAPSREARKDVAPTISARTKGGGGLGTDFDLDGGLIAGDVPEVSPAMKARDYKGVSSDGDGDGLPVIPMFAIQAGALRENPNSGPDGVGVQADIAYTLEARAEVQAVSVTGEISHTLKAEGFDASEDGTGRGNPIIAFSSKDYGANAGELSPTLHAGGHSESHANAGVPPAVAFVQNSRSEVRLVNGDGAIVGAIAAEPGVQQQNYIAQTVALRGRDGGATAELGGEVATALRASQGGGDKPHILAFQPGNLTRGAGAAPSAEIFPTLKSDHGRGLSDQMPHVMTSAVRRLTPVECERLQGFKDNYTKISDEATDGPRYKALGNSMAVPVMRWIGERIDRFMPREEIVAPSARKRLRFRPDGRMVFE